MVAECKLTFLFCPSANGLWPGSQPWHSSQCHSVGARIGLPTARRFASFILSSHRLRYVRQPVNPAQQGDQQLSPSHWSPLQSARSSRMGPEETAPASAPAPMPAAQQLAVDAHADAKSSGSGSDDSDVATL